MLENWRGGFPFGVEEGKFDDPGADAVAHRFNRGLHLQHGAGRGVRALNTGKRNQFLAELAQGGRWGVVEVALPTCTPVR